MAIAVVIACVLLGVFVHRTAGDVTYDDAVYLERGLYHAHQVEHRPAWQIPARLAYSLRFEGPKPPLYHGWVAACALIVDWAEPRTWIFLAMLGPLLALLVAASWGGWRAERWAALASVIALMSMPGVRQSASHAMVEVLLTALVTLAAVLLAQDVERPRPWLPWCLGAVLAMAVLTKLTAPLFLLLPVAWYAWRSAKRSGARDAALRIVRVGVLGAALALPWFGFWLGRALDFAEFSAANQAWADEGSAWSRPLRLIGETVGWPLAILGLALTVGSRWRAVQPRERRSLCGTLAMLSAVPAAVVVCTPVNFEPRFWIPATGLLAVAIGARCVGFLESRGWSGAWAPVVLAPVLAVSLASRGRLSEAPPPPWSAIPLFEHLAAREPQPKTVCQLGSSPGWNIFRSRLAIEISGKRTVLEVRDLLGEVEDREQLAQACDLILVLDRNAIPQDRSHRMFNSRYEEVLLRLTAAGFAGRETIPEIALTGAPLRLLAGPSG